MCVCVCVCVIIRKFTHPTKNASRVRTQLFFIQRSYARVDKSVEGVF